MSLTKLIVQRRRWFNGSMFATFHVMKSMLRVWKRKKSFADIMRNVLFMFQYVYMLVLTALSFLLVGTFYAAFSIFVRTTLDSSNCLDAFKPANFFENLYLIFIVACLLLSITVKITEAEFAFRLCSFGMGLFTILMLVSTIFYSLDQDVAPVVIIAIAVSLGTSLLPLVLNINRLKV